jgi:hypothetical protein
MRMTELEKLAKSLLDGKVDVVDEIESIEPEIEGDLLDAITSPSLPIDVIRRISESDIWNLLVALTNNPKLPMDILKEIAFVPRSGIYHYNVQQAILLNENIDETLRIDLLNGKTPNLWSHLESSEKQRRKDVLIKSAQDNPTESSLNSLALLYEEAGEVEKAHGIWLDIYGPAPKDSDKSDIDIDEIPFGQLLDIAKHPLTKKELLLQLSFSNDDELESWIAANPSAPPCIIAYYAESLGANGEPLSYALANPKIPSYVWPWVEDLVENSSMNWEAHQLIVDTAAMNHGLPLNLMEKFAKSSFSNERYELLNNVCLPKDISVQK